MKFPIEFSKICAVVGTPNDWSGHLDPLTISKVTNIGMSVGWFGTNYKWIASGL